VFWCVTLYPFFGGRGVRHHEDFLVVTVLTTGGTELIIK
jgi:hypothetical protein